MHHLPASTGSAARNLRARPTLAGPRWPDWQAQPHAARSTPSASRASIRPSSASTTGGYQLLQPQVQATSSRALTPNLTTNPVPSNITTTGFTVAFNTQNPGDTQLLYSTSPTGTCTTVPRAAPPLSNAHSQALTEPAAGHRLLRAGRVRQRRGPLGVARDSHDYGFALVGPHQEPTSTTRWMIRLALRRQRRRVHAQRPRWPIRLA
ncbi:MAG: hypothetical protein WKG07_29060 [Hymenobacter sp.]